MAGKKTHVAIFVVMSIIGSGIMLYPSFSELYNSKRQTKAIADYHTEVFNASNEKLEEVLAGAQRFNEKLKVRGHSDPEELRAEYNNALRLDVSDVIAFIEIPKISVYLPIYHGAEEKVLQVGVGHLEGTSLPIGGPGTHSALSGHRGLPSAKLFTNLDKIEIGDGFIVHVLGKHLYYEVDQIEVVLPEQVEKLSMEQGRDLVTLITCTPYAVNTHRLLVRGTRVEGVGLPEESIALGAPEGEPGPESAALPFQAQLSLAGAVLALAIKVILELRRKKLREERARAQRERRARPTPGPNTRMA